jgi:hypothetical protein
MPKQTKPIKLTGTLGETTFYKMKGKYLLRKKTNLTKTRVSTDAAFENSRKASQQFAKAVVIPKAVYATLPPSKKGHGVFGKLNGMANVLLAKGMSEEEVSRTLENFLYCK